jgi:hypothetical protein
MDQAKMRGVTSLIGPSNISSTLRAAALLSLAALSLACSSSSPSGSPSTAPGAQDAAALGNGGPDANAGGVTAGACADSPVTWLDDGVMHCASLATGTLGYNTIHGVDGGDVTEVNLEMVILQSNTSYIFGLSVGGPAPLGGDYSCSVSLGSPNLVEISYDEVGSFSTTAASCTVTVTLTPDDGGVDGGNVATGTFSAMLNVTDGGTKVLSQGTFSLPVTAINE